MKEQIEVVGTTPDVLQHYLTAGVECQVIAGAYKGATAKLYGLNLGMAFPVRLYDGVGMPTPAISLRLEDILPVLRPFSALCQPLEDGTVPAVEVAKLFNDYPTTLVDWKNADVWQTGDTGEFYVAANHLARNGYIKMSMWPDWSFVGSRDRTRQALDYLRSKHFAVGLEPHQYVEKAPTPAPAAPPVAEEPG